PVDTEELVTAEAVWIAVRAGTYGCVPMVVAMVFGLDPSWGMLAVPPIAMVAGFGWAAFGIAIASKMNSFENFSYVISAVLTPLFLVAGTFFPLDELPGWAQALAWFNPLFHLVELVRHAVFGWEFPLDLAHMGILIVFGLITWRIAVAGMTRKLIS
ncbi:MAG: ABC transporter permease, partial [Thermoleophilia bacterium]|nr:ABC transporter permease [Thermoleophilia bacterium]